MSEVYARISKECGKPLLQDVWRFSDQNRRSGGSKVRDGGGFNLQSLTQTLVVIECSQCGVAVRGQQLAKRPLNDGC